MGIYLTEKASSERNVLISSYEYYYLNYPMSMDKYITLGIHSGQTFY